jgi:hypothetical protein
VLLDVPQRLRFPDGMWADVERCACDPEVDSFAIPSPSGEETTAVRQDCVRVRMPGHDEIVLRAAIDTTELLAWPRLFAITGERPDEVLTFGGELAYRLGSDGRVREVLRTFRQRGDEEYWDTAVVEAGGALGVIYEAGVLMIDPNLQPRWHVRKRFNDFFRTVEGGLMLFEADHRDRWTLRIEDGARG